MGDYSAQGFCVLYGVGTVGTLLWRAWQRVRGVLRTPAEALGIAGNGLRTRVRAASEGFPGPTRKRIGFFKSWLKAFPSRLPAAQRSRPVSQLERNRFYSLRRDERVFR